MTNLRVALFPRALPAAYDARASTGDRDRPPRRGTRVALAIVLAGWICACGHYDQRLCRSRHPLDYTLAVSDTEFQSFVDDDGELDQTECAALCDCLSPVPNKSIPRPDATTDVDADAGEAEAGGGGAGGASGDGGPGGRRCFPERDGDFTYWGSCTYRRSGGGYGLLRCVGSTVSACG
jgi:hypothetical protein